MSLKTYSIKYPISRKKRKRLTIYINKDSYINKLKIFESIKKSQFS